MVNARRGLLRNLQCPPADVSTVLHPVERNLFETVVGVRNGRCVVEAAADNGQDAPAAGDGPPIPQRGAGVKDRHTRDPLGGVDPEIGFPDSNESG